MFYGLNVARKFLTLNCSWISSSFCQVSDQHWRFCLVSLSSLSIFCISSSFASARHIGTWPSMITEWSTWWTGGRFVAWFGSAVRFSCLYRFNPIKILLHSISIHQAHPGTPGSREANMIPQRVLCQRFTLKTTWTLAGSSMVSAIGQAHLAPLIL